jgi:hypothetical protein
MRSEGLAVDSLGTESDGLEVMRDGGYKCGRAAVRDPIGLVISVDVQPVE